MSQHRAKTETEKALLFSDLCRWNAVGCEDTPAGRAWLADADQYDPRVDVHHRLRDEEYEVYVNRRNAALAQEKAERLLKIRKIEAIEYDTNPLAVIYRYEGRVNTAHPNYDKVVENMKKLDEINMTEREKARSLSTILRALAEKLKTTRPDLVGHFLMDANQHDPSRGDNHRLVGEGYWDWDARVRAVWRKEFKEQEAIDKPIREARRKAEDEEDEWEWRFQQQDPKGYRRYSTLQARGYVDEITISPRVLNSAYTQLLTSTELRRF